MATNKCIICRNHPAMDADGICHNCRQKINSMAGGHQDRKPFRFVVYQGHTVAFFRRGDGSLKPELTMRDPGNLPTSITINLDGYADGFSRSQVKKMKATVLALAGA